VTPASGIRIGRIFGISIYLHPSWFLISVKQEFNIAIAGPISSFFLSNGLLLPSPFSAFWNACRQKIFNQMPVLDDGRVVGMIARDSILRVLQARLQVGHLAEQ
jgi:hypothetical protein